jgi:hypothetical protein
MSESAKELRDLSVALLDNGKLLRKDAEAARERSAIRKEHSRLARESAGAWLNYATAARKRRNDR